MGYDKGKFVPYSDDFKLKVMMDKQKAVTAGTLKEIKPGDMNGNQANGSNETKN